MPDFRRLGLVGVAGIASVFVLAACGGGSAHASSATTPSTVGSSSASNGGNGRGRLIAFDDCMSSHGVTLRPRLRTGSGTPPSTNVGGRGSGSGFGSGFANRLQNPPPGVNPTKYQTALNACRSKLPTGGSRLNSSAFQGYRSCLSNHGVQLPAQGQTINRNDPKVQAAMKTCASLLPQGFGNGTTTTTRPKA